MLRIRYFRTLLFTDTAFSPFSLYNALQLTLKLLMLLFLIPTIRFFSAHSQRFLARIYSSEMSDFPIRSVNLLFGIEVWHALHNCPHSLMRNLPDSTMPIHIDSLLVQSQTYLFPSFKITLIPRLKKKDNTFSSIGVVRHEMNADSGPLRSTISRIRKQPM